MKQKTLYLGRIVWVEKYYHLNKNPYLNIKYGQDNKESV